MSEMNPADLFQIPLVAIERPGLPLETTTDGRIQNVGERTGPAYLVAPDAGAKCRPDVDSPTVAIPGQVGIA